MSGEVPGIEIGLVLQKTVVDKLDTEYHGY